MKEESEKVGLKLNIQKTKIMASSHITSWQIDGETVADFFWAPKSVQMVIAAMKLKDAYSLEGMLWGHKELDTTELLNWTELNWDSILKSRDIICQQKPI